MKTQYVLLKETLMSYTQKISRVKPGLIGLVLDDSLSMIDKLPGTSDPKYQWVERYFGIFLEESLSRCSEVRGSGVVIQPRYYLYVLKYGSDTELWGNGEMDIEAAVELFSNSGNSLGLGGHLGGTDAKKALRQMYDYLTQALAGERFKDSFPPMIFHSTDGESWTDATDDADQIKQLSTSDGNVLMVNAYIGTQTSLSYAGPDDFPGYADPSEAGPGEDNVRLFNMSSEAPECILDNLRADNIFPKIRSSSRLFFDVRTKETLKHSLQVVGSMGSRMAR
jgi:hypothetical protein